MFQSLLEVKDYLKREKIEIIDFKIADFTGRWRHLSIPASRFDRNLMERGVGFDGSSYGFLTVDRSDMVFIPDITSAFRMPMASVPTLCMIGDIHTLSEGRPRFEDDPRFIVQKAKSLMASLGIADTMLLGPEFEFYVLDKIAVHNEINHMEVYIDSEQGCWNASRKDSNTGLNLRRFNGYHLDRPWDTSADLRDQVILYAEKTDIPIKYHHSENGGPGQVEIEVNHADILDMADRTQKLKALLRQFAQAAGKTVTFMPKPFNGECGSGFHIHIHLFKDGKPLFYDPTGYSGLSEMALHAIGGILHHAPALMPFTNPSTNSYKRLIPGYEAPVSICFATANRSAVIRIPAYATEPEEKRFEIRFPDLTCNPYLAFSAVLMAMIDGIENRIDPVAEGFGPYDLNLYELPDDKKALVKGLPRDPQEAAAALETDQQFLMRGGVFSETLIAGQIEKIRSDHARVSSMPHPEEYLMYYNL